MSTTPAPQFIVGRIDGTDESRRFATMEEVVAYQATLDQEALEDGAYYLDDLQQGE